MKNLLSSLALDFSLGMVIIAKELFKSTIFHVRNGVARKKLERAVTIAGLNGITAQNLCDHGGDDDTIIGLA